MIYVSNYSEEWIERTKEDHAILDNNGRVAIMTRLWKKLNDLDDLKRVFSNESDFRSKIEEYIRAGGQHRTLQDFLMPLTDEILVFGK